MSNLKSFYSKNPLALYIGFLFVVLGVLVNKWTLNMLLIFFLEKEIDLIRLKALYTLQVSAILIGLGLFFLNKTKSYLKSIVPNLDKKSFVYILILMLPNIVFWAFACNSLRLNYFSIFGLFCFVLKSVGSFIVLYSMLILMSKIHRFASVCFNLLYVFFICIETALVFFLHERFELKFLNMIKSADYTAYFSWKIIVLIVVTSFLVSFLTINLAKITTHEPWNKFFQISLIAILISYSPLILAANVIYSTPFGSVKRYLSLSEAALFNYLHDEPIIRVFKLLTNKKKKFSQCTSLDKKSKKIAQKYHLFNTSQKLMNCDFNRIVTVSSESLSYAYLELKRSNLSLMPNYNYYKKNFLSCNDYKTTSTTTLNGLSVTWCSHPNSSLLLKLGMPNSFVKILKNYGWITAFFRSDPENFQNGMKYIPNAGFCIYRGRNYYQKKYKKYISNWGIPDRFIYEEAVQFLYENKNKKIFIQILGCDTHLPAGRTIYFDFEYPQPPDWIIGHSHEDLLMSCLKKDCLTIKHL